MNSFSSSLSVENALHSIRKWVHPLAATEKIPLQEALWRVLAEDIVAPVNVPPWNNAAMDGYAFSAAGLDLGKKQTLNVIGSAFAGHHFRKTVPPHTCVRIMTGSVMPLGCDTVVPQENVQTEGNTITILPENISAGDNVRQQGEDIKARTVCLFKGTLLKPPHLGMMASIGANEIKVFKRPTVALISTGDELCHVGEPLADGGIYDSNRYVLRGMLQRLGCRIIDMGIVRDDPELIRKAFIKAIEQADAIITTGGVSVGSADYTRVVMAEMADMAFWNVNMRPGRPMAFGRALTGKKETFLFGLPGNPVAVMVTFCFFVREALLCLMGARPSPLPRLRVRTLSALAKRPGRTEFQRGILSPDSHGNWQVQSTGPQGSGLLSSMTQANCIIVLPAEGTAVAPGEEVEVVLLEGLI